MVSLVNAAPARRQQQAGIAPTGNSSESARDRHEVRSVRVTIHHGHSLLLMDDPPTLASATGAGDQTVPTISSDHQLLRGKFKGFFRQTGYEHQNSYKDTRALHSTLFSIAKIAAQMRWEST
jgi:hypothetical protein